MTNPVRIAHFSDTHLGYRAAGRLEPETGRNQRTVDVDTAFTATIDDILTQNVDMVIHGGDVFHHSRPTWQSLRHFIRQMRRLEQAGIPTLVIGGNHDTPRVRTGGSAYSVLELALPEIIFVCGYIDEEISAPFAHLNLRVQAVPHGALTNPDKPIVQPTISGMYNLVTTHGIASGVLRDGLVNEPGEEELPSTLVSSAGVDYFALGHIHQAQAVGVHTWYSGSTERFGWSDEQANPGYNIVELTTPGGIPAVTRRLIATRPMVRLRPESGNGRTGREIADAVLNQAVKLGDPAAMARVELKEVDRPTRREVQSLLRRESPAIVWSLDLVPERQLLVAQGDTPHVDDSALDLHALFAEFVALRRPTYPSEAFASALLEHGGRALTDAMVSGEAPLPEDDSLS